MNRNDFLQEQLDLLQTKRDDPKLDWQDINDFRVDSLGIIEAVDTTRKGAKLINEYLDAGWSIVPPTKNNIISISTATTANKSDDVSFLNEDLIALKKERAKLQSEKIEFNKNLRELARDELITEHIVQAIKDLPKLEAPKAVDVTHDNRSFLLCIADCHFGIEFSIPDFWGETLNEYSPEIFYDRMELLYSKVLEVIERENIHELNIFDLGDDLSGIIRLNSQLMQLRYGIVESTILFAEYVATWLNKLSNHVRIKYQAAMNGNHSQLRLLGAPKNAFPDENMEKIIHVFLKERLKDNPNITFYDNPTGLNYALMSGYVVVGCHGEIKDMSRGIDELSRLYSVPISYIVTGHMHHKQSEEVGVDSEVIRVGSIIGLDSYSVSLRKASNASASLFVFEQGNGKTMEYCFKLS